MVEDGRFTWPLPFWEQPLWRWDAMMTAGVRAAFVASQLAAGMMVARRRGLIVSLSFWPARTYVGNVPYGVSKALIAADVAQRYGFTDIDGRQPTPLSLNDA
jgi:NAD(P)-dependent dehydrogenase (short-subunit alcohol dehydrogenase family)